MSDQRPDHPPRWIGMVKEAFLAVKEALGLVPSGKRLELDEGTNAAILAILAQGPNGIGLPEALERMPDVALILVQNVGREAFRELLRRIAEDPAFRQGTAARNGGPKSQSSVRQDAYVVMQAKVAMEASEAVAKASKTWPTFDSPDKVMRYYRGVCRKMFLRALKRETTRADNEIKAAQVQGSDPDESDYKKVEAALLVELDLILDKCTLEQRVAYVLKYRLDWNNAEVNDLLWPSNRARNAEAKRKAVERTANAKGLLLKAKIALKKRKPDDPDSPWSEG